MLATKMLHLFIFLLGPLSLRFSSSDVSGSVFPAHRFNGKNASNCLFYYCNNKKNPTLSLTTPRSSKNTIHDSFCFLLSFPSFCVVNYYHMEPQ